MLKVALFTLRLVIVQLVLAAVDLLLSKVATRTRALGVTLLYKLAPVLRAPVEAYLSSLCLPRFLVARSASHLGRPCRRTPGTSLCLLALGALEEARSLSRLEAV